MIWAAYTFGTVYALWLFYLAVMHLARAREAGTLSRPALYLGYPLFLIGYALDVFVQMVLATVLFLDLPREWTLTGRLKRYIAGPEGWRETVAIWMCAHLLNAFDPDGRHC
jgi:hypothetical protein